MLIGLFDYQKTKKSKVLIFTFLYSSRLVMAKNKNIRVGSVVMLKGKKYKNQKHKIGIITNILNPEKVFYK